MPQIELMMSDLPHTLYKKTGKKGEGPSAEDIDEATRLFMESQARKSQNTEGSHTVEELFNGDAD